MAAPPPETAIQAAAGGPQLPLAAGAARAPPAELLARTEMRWTRIRAQVAPQQMVRAAMPVR